MLLVSACSGTGEQPPVEPVPEAGYIVVRTQPVELFIELPGRTSAYETSEVRPQVSGIVRERLFEEGSRVKAGQRLYEIDANVYRTAAAEARASVQEAQATLVAARGRADRYASLLETDVVSQQDAADAEAAALEAAAALTQAQAQLESARIDLGYTRVNAPITGRIGRSIVTTGALVTSGQAEPLATIQRLDPIFVDIQQASADLLALRRSLAGGGVVRSAADVELTLSDNSIYAHKGTVQFAEAVVDPNTGSVTLRARFPNPDDLLLPGMYVRARLSQATTQDAILVPQQGVARDPNGDATVVVVGEGDKAQLRTIEVARTVRDQWLVTNGLQPGERVIVEGLSRIEPNELVKPVPAGSPSPERTAEFGGAKPGQRRLGDR